MLSEAQLAHLEHLVHSISTELHIEEATLDAQVEPLVASPSL